MPFEGLQVTPAAGVAREQQHKGQRSREKGTVLGRADDSQHPGGVCHMALGMTFGVGRPRSCCFTTA